MQLVFRNRIFTLFLYMISFGLKVIPKRWSLLLAIREIGINQETLKLRAYIW